MQSNGLVYKTGEYECVLKRPNKKIKPLITLRLYLSTLLYSNVSLCTHFMYLSLLCFHLCLSRLSWSLQPVFDCVCLSGDDCLHLLVMRGCETEEHQRTPVEKQTASSRTAALIKRQINIHAKIKCVYWGLQGGRRRWGLKIKEGAFEVWVFAHKTFILKPNRIWIGEHVILYVM